MRGVRRRLLTSCDAQVDFELMEKLALSSPDPAHDLPSGSAELYEIMLSSYIR